ncbi:hypothetical protein Tco_0328975 [Tanacetum coccineum]
MDLSDYEVPRVLVTCRNQEDWTENCILIHFILGRQLELTGDENENIPLYYHVVDNFQIQFGKEEFCLVTGLKFGVENWTDYNNAEEPIPFRRRVFSSSLNGRPIRGKNVETLIKSEAFNKLDDNDAVSLCCVDILQLVLLGLEDRHPVPNWILRMQMLNVGRPYKPTDEIDKKNYSNIGFAWAFKTRILESFRAATNDYYTRYRRLPRIVAWSSKKKFYRDMLKPFLHGQLPVERLVPDEIEARSRWWVSSRAYFDGYSKFATPLSRRILNICDRARREHKPSVYMLSPYTVLPPTTVLPKKRTGKTKKKGKAAKLSPLNLGNTFADEHVSREDVTITGVQQTDNYFLMKTWTLIRSDWSWPEGWLSGDHMNSCIQILIREGAENDNWTLFKSGTICLHPENNRFMILTDPYIIGTLDGSMRPYPSWKDVNWVYMPINVGGVHWVTGAINLADSIC